MNQLKNIASISIGVLIVCSALYFWDKCTLKYFNKRIYDEYSVLEDQTDPHRYTYNCLEFGRFSELTGRGELNLILNFKPLSQYDDNPIYSFKWHGKHPLFSNPYSRERDVSAFLQSIDDSIKSIRLRFHEPSQSHLYEGIVNEYNRLAKCKRNKCTLLVYSNLHQRSTLFDIYQLGERNELSANPASVTERLEKYAMPVSSSNMTIYFLFQPASEIEDANFHMMANVLKTIFEKGGAKVIIASNLNPYERS